MSDNPLRLLASRRFLPLFVCQFLGAANDNVFKNALVILVVYRLGDGLGVPPSLLVTAAGGIFILPFFLFSATAGQIADRFEKSRLMRLVKLAEIPIALLGAWSLAAASVPAMMAVLFLFGVHSTVFGPLKYAVLPEWFQGDELTGANALVEGGTFLAILLGTVAGGMLVLGEGGIAWVSALMVAAALLGYGASLMLPKAHRGEGSVRIGANILADTAQVLRLARARRPVFAAVLGISWFWLVGATFLAQFPAFAREVLVADERAVTLMLTVFSVGVGAGSLLCGRLLRGRVSLAPVPWAGLGMGLAALDLWLATSGLAGGGETLAPLAELLARPVAWRVLADLLVLSICGGVYIVPLYVVMQVEAEEAVRARVVAANNILNAAFMVVSALAAGAMLAAGLSIPGIFLVLGVLNTAVALIWLRRSPPLSRG